MGSSERSALINRKNPARLRLERIIAVVFRDKERRIDPLVNPISTIFGRSKKEKGDRKIGATV